MGSFRYLLSCLVFTAIWLGSVTAAEAQKVVIQLGLPSNGFKADVLAQVFNNPTCTGSPVSSQDMKLGSDTVGVAVSAAQSVKLTAPENPVDGGDAGFAWFINWTGDGPFTPLHPQRIVCVPGPPGEEVRTMLAFYEAPRVFVPPVTCGNVSFTPFSGFPIPVGLPETIAIGDVDSDGANDIVSANVIDDRLDIFYGNGHGGFTPPLSIRPPNLYNNGSSLTIRNPHILDLNGDGRNDIVAVMQNVDQLAVLLSNPGGGFTVTSTFMTIAGAVGPWSLAMGDMNNDGRPDAVSGNSVNRAGIAVRLNNGNGTFAGTTGLPLVFADNPARTAVADFNGDGFNDVIAIIDSGIGVYPGNGTGAVSNPIRTTITGMGLFSGLAVADFDEDGKMDVAYSNVGIGVRFGTGQATFTGGVTLPLPAESVNLITNDVNGDGHADLIAATSRGAIVYQGDGHGGFLRVATLGPTVNAQTWGIAVGDVNNDGRVDVATGVWDSDQQAGALHLFQNTCEANAAPVVTPMTITRQIGTAASASVIATAADNSTPSGALAVSLGAASPGINVTDVVNDEGAISAMVYASCSATAGAASFQINVTDAQGLTTSGNVIVNVTPDATPTLGEYADTKVSAGGAVKVTPSAPPSDNGSINSIMVAAPGFGGTLVADLESGEVSVIDVREPGTYTVTVTAIDNCGARIERSFLLTVRGVGSITLSGLQAIYDGQPHVVKVSTSPANLAGLTVRYSQNQTPVVEPILPGSYDVEASINDPIYDAPVAHGVLVIERAQATLQFGAMNFRFDGLPKFATVTTSPKDLDGVSISYRDAKGVETVAPVLAGSYEVVARLTHDLYQAKVITGTLTIEPAVATITMSGATFTYDGAPKALTATVVPANASPTSVSYVAPTGEPVTKPTNAGTYLATATINNPNYVASPVQATLMIEPIVAKLAWTAPAPIEAGTPLSGAQLNASASVPGRFSYTPAIGTVLAAGVHTLTAVFTPEDAINFVGGTVTTMLTVTAPPAPSVSLRQTKQNLLNELKKLRASVTDRQTVRGLDDAINDVENSLAPQFWEKDGNHLNRANGSQVFNLEKQAALRLREMISNKHTIIDDVHLREFIVGFAQVDRGLAAQAIADSGNQSTAAAQKDLLKGDDHLNEDRIAPAFEQYRKAWEDATRERR